MSGFLAVMLFFSIQNCQKQQFYNQLQSDYDKCESIFTPCYKHPSQKCLDEHTKCIEDFKRKYK